jgi:5-methylcytosine-specific restriction endonuclease McrA
MFCKRCGSDKNEFRKWKRVCKPCEAACSLIRYHSKPKPNRTLELKKYQREYQAEYRLKNPQRIKEYIKKSYSNSRKDPLRIAKTKYLNAKYRASKNAATPHWLSEEQKKQMILFYKNCPAGMEVDHIVPLQGKEVQGLHVPWNLQYLSKSENSRKKNRLMVENNFNSGGL